MFMLLCDSTECQSSEHLLCAVDVRLQAYISNRGLHFDGKLYLASILPNIVSATISWRVQWTSSTHHFEPGVLVSESQLQGGQSGLNNGEYSDPAD
eukprot:353171-Chlamydomonas_euryale.AAC.10